ncbi:hypothetical protein R3P38DRAFT_2795064 [Favolaschia claudopus]|uniref:Uncharacterized protein n=1 Tax=Favolaschia claudopus TaxID=2862362 RepID=A0AAW0A7Y2_9AGAR
MTQGLWFSQTHKKALGTVENATYDEKHCFNNSRTKLQGELRAVLVVLPEELHGDMGKTWFMHTFNSAIIRNDIGAVFVAHLHPRVKDGLDILYRTCRSVLDNDGADRLNVDTFLNHNLVMHEKGQQDGEKSTVLLWSTLHEGNSQYLEFHARFHRLRWYKVVLDFVCKVMLGPLPETADDRNQKSKSTAAFQY